MADRPRYSWQEAVVQYLGEMAHKASHGDDAAHCRWLDRFFGGLTLAEINHDLLERVIAILLRSANEKRPTSL